MQQQSTPTIVTVGIEDVTYDRKCQNNNFPNTRLHKSSEDVRPTEKGYFGRLLDRQEVSK